MGPATQDRVIQDRTIQWERIGDRTIVKERVVERRREGEVYVGGFGGLRGDTTMIMRRARAL